MDDKFKDVTKEELLECYNTTTDFLKFLASEIEQSSEGEKQ